MASDEADPGKVPPPKYQQPRGGLFPPCLLQMFGFGSVNNDFARSSERTVGLSNDLPFCFDGALTALQEADAAIRCLNHDLDRVTCEKKAVHVAVLDALSELRLLQINHSTLCNSLGTSPTLTVQAIGSDAMHEVASIGSWGANVGHRTDEANRRGPKSASLETAQTLHGGIKQMQESTVDLLKFVNNRVDMPASALQRQLADCMASNIELKLQLVKAEVSSASSAESLLDGLQANELLKAKLCQIEDERDAAFSQAMRAEEALANMVAEAATVEEEAAMLRRSEEGTAAVEVLDALPIHDPPPPLSPAEKDLNEKLTLKAYILRLEAELGNTKSREGRLARTNAILEAQIEQLEYNLNHLSEDRAKRLCKLQDELAHVCGWALNVEHDCAQLEQDNAFLESFLPDETKEQIKSSLLASGLSVSGTNTPAQSASPSHRNSLDATSPFHNNSPEKAPDGIVAKSEAPSKPSECSSELAASDRKLSTLLNAKPRVPSLNLRWPMPSKALETSNLSSQPRRSIGDRSGNPKRRGNPPRVPLSASLGTFPPSSPEARTEEYELDSAPATCRDHDLTAFGMTGRSQSYQSDSGQAAKWVTHLEELHLNAQKKAHQVLLERLENAVERLGAAESALAGKDKELDELRALVNPPAVVNKRKGASKP